MIANLTPLISSPRHEFHRWPVITDSHPLDLFKDQSPGNPRRLLASCLLVALIAVFALGGVAPAAHALSCDVTYDPISNIPSAQLTISAPGTYCFNAGTYDTQITITSSDVTLQPTTSSMVVTIQPTSVTSNLVNPISSAPQAAIVAVVGVADVTVDGLAVDGSVASSSITTCAPPKYIGIAFSGASGVVTNAQITNIYPASSSLYGCQDSAGAGIYVETGTSGVSTVSITSNTITNYQKAGIVCNDAGSICTISGNTVSPLAAAQPYTASNGIQLGFGATGTITGNTVSGNVCTDVAADCLDSDMIANGGPGTGILTYQSAGAVTISENTLTGNDVGILGYQDAGPVVSISNIILGSTYVGVVVYDESQTVSGNAFVSEPVGIEAVSDSPTFPATARVSCNTFTAVPNPTATDKANGGLAFTPTGETCLETPPGVPQFPAALPLALVTAISFLGVVLLRSKSLPRQP
jgi:hypothetical protein